MKSKISKSAQIAAWLKMTLIGSAVVSAFVLCLACSGASPAFEDKSEGLRVLFIGNSLTYTNDLPGMLQRMLENSDIQVGKIEALAKPNFGLQDHWARGTTFDRISNGNWDVVVLQQGPSATEGRPSLLKYSQQFAEEISKTGARTALYMVWPSDFRSFDFNGVSDSYQTAAELVNGLLFPAEEAWRAAWRRDSTLALYGSDGFHPSLLGTYLAALVMFEQLAGRDPHELSAAIPTTSGNVEISADLAKLLQDAAVEANAQFSRN